MLVLTGDSEVSKRLLWQQNWCVIVIVKTFCEQLQLKSYNCRLIFFLSGKLGVDLDAIDVTRGLVALWHKRFFCSSNRKQGH